MRSFGAGSPCGSSNMVTRHPRTTAVGMLPDWPAVADEYDAVHFTMTAAVALQGTSYRLPNGSETVPIYVDVESTVWLRWAFTAAVNLADRPTWRPLWPPPFGARNRCFVSLRMGAAMAAPGLRKTTS